MSKKELRQKELIGIIERHGILNLRILSSMLKVSEMTIRRDLEALQAQTVDGNAIHEDQYAHSSDENANYSLLQALKRENEHKNRIGEFAASMMCEGEVIIIDTGSTTARILPYIPDGKNLTVLCFNTNVLLKLRYKPGIQLFFSGGIYHPNTELCECPQGIQFIESIRANKVFLSAAGIHETLGITCANAYEVPTKKAIIRSSLERILVVDSSKFNQLCPAYFCELSDINTIVTNDNLSDEWQSLIKNMGIKIHLV